MAAEPDTVQFSIGRVIGDSFGVLARNIVSFGILALLINLIPLVFGLFFLDTSQLEAAQNDPAQLEAAMQNFNWWSLILAALLMIVVSFLTQAAIIYGTFQDLRGQKASIGDCIARGLSSIIAVIIGSILLALGLMIGFVFLIVPAVILALMWWVYVPAIVVEGKGIIEAFGRSRELTRGRRWHILGLLIVLLILMVVVGLIAQVVIMIIASQDGMAGTIIEYVFNALLTAFIAVLVAVAYYYLRAEKEGVNVNEIARIFD
jgi:magnesium-transporting ATPase (P-type)